MLSRCAVTVVLVALPALCADWNPRLAADYLDSRQKVWFTWPPANKGEGGPCLSCHTGLTYLLARPALSRALGEDAPTNYQTDLLEALRRRVSKKTVRDFAPNLKEPHASEATGVEAVLAALLVGSEEAFERMWSLQIATGKSKGAWNWNNFDLDPWEEPDSMFYGASLAALAVGRAPSNYQARLDIQPNLEALKAYLTSQQQAQPLHNRLILVWASTRLRGALSESDRKAILDEVLRRQQEDGGWTIESLGAWTKHPRAPASQGSNAYATGLVAFVLEKTGMSRANGNLNRALDWLRTHQDLKSGYWEARSMNKEYDPDSVPVQFMRDAATAFAALALVESH